MSKKPMISGGQGYNRLDHESGFVVMAGASAPTAVGGYVTSAERLESTVGAVPFLRITLHNGINPNKDAVSFGLRFDTAVIVQETNTLLSTVAPAAQDSARQIDVRFFDAAGVAVEPPDGGKLSIFVDFDQFS